MPPRGSAHKGSSLATKAIALLLVALILLPANPNVASAALGTGSLGDVGNTAHSPANAGASGASGSMGAPGPVGGVQNIPTGNTFGSLTSAPTPTPSASDATTPVPPGSPIDSGVQVQAPLSTDAISPASISPLENRVSLLYAALKSGRTEAIQHAWAQVARTVDTQALRDTPDTRIFLDLLRSVGARTEYKTIFDGALEISEPADHVVSLTFSVNGRTYLLATNRSNRYVGVPLAPYLRLAGGGTHFSAIESAPAIVKSAPRAAGVRATFLKGLRADWNAWAVRIALLAVVFFTFLHAPQIVTNTALIKAAHAGQILILPWIGYSMGIVGNSNLWSFFIGQAQEKAEAGDRSQARMQHALAFVQGVAVVTSAVVLSQIFTALAITGSLTTASAAAAVFMPWFIKASVTISLLKWTRILPTSLFGVNPWELWKKFSTVLGLFALPLGASSFLGLLDSHLVLSTAAGALFAAIGASILALDAKGKLTPTQHETLVNQGGGWAGNALFLLIACNMLMSTILHPDDLSTLALGSILLSNLGNLCEFAGAFNARVLFGVAGNGSSIAIYGYPTLLYAYLTNPSAIKPWVIPLGILGSLTISFPVAFWASTVLIPAYFIWLIRNEKIAKGHESYRETVRFITDPVAKMFKFFGALLKRGVEMMWLLLASCT